MTAITFLERNTFFTCFLVKFVCLVRFGTMLEGYSPIIQALLGTLFTWGLTAAGAALVFVFSSYQVKKKLTRRNV